MQIHSDNTAQCANLSLITEPGMPQNLNLYFCVCLFVFLGGCGYLDLKYPSCNDNISLNHLAFHRGRLIGFGRHFGSVSI